MGIRLVRSHEGRSLAVLERRVTLWRWAGLVVGVGAAVWASDADRLGRGVMLAPAIAASGVLLGVLAGELSAGRLRVTRRSASLAVRRVRDHLPPVLTGCVVLTTVGLGVLLVWTTVIGSADDMGRDGRALTVVCSGTTSSSGPWPGSFYSAPLAVALVGGLALAVAGVLAVVRRRSVVDPDDPASTAADHVVRRRSTEAVVAAYGSLVAASGAGVAAVTALVMHQPSCAPAWWAPLRWGLAGFVAAALVLFVWCAVAVLAPRGRDVVDAPFSPVR